MWKIITFFLRRTVEAVEIKNDDEPSNNQVESTQVCESDVPVSMDVVPSPPRTSRVCFLKTCYCVQLSFIVLTCTVLNISTKWEGQSLNRGRAWCFWGVHPCLHDAGDTWVFVENGGGRGLGYALPTLDSAYKEEQNNLPILSQMQWGANKFCQGKLANGKFLVFTGHFFYTICTYCFI